MDQQQAADVLRNLDLRTRRMEQILPDLPTREEVRTLVDTSIREAVAPLATRQDLADARQEIADARLEAKRDLDEAVARLATKDELRKGLADLRDELRGHMDIWAERIADLVKPVAESTLALEARTDRSREEIWAELRRLASTDDRQHADVMKDLERMRARLLKAEGKPPRKRKAS
jgi:hypothetical protein